MSEPPMKVRPANAADLERCRRLDRSLATSFVWRVDETVGADNIGVTFRRVRAPRPLPLDYPRDIDSLYDDWRRDECVLVAYEFVTVLGFVLVTVQRGERDGWVKHLVVGRPHRRQGVATRLLESAAAWALANGLERVTVILQSKNDPGIQLLAKCGYLFRGFIDHHFANGEAGMLYSLYL